MKRSLAALLFVLLAAGVVCGQARGGWLRGGWSGTAYQTDSADTWTMILNFGRGSYRAVYPSLECEGRWRLLRVSRTRATFRETITKGAERCAPRGRVVVERLNARQLGYRYSYQGSNDFVASAILNAPAARTAPSAHEFELKDGQSVSFDGGRLRIRFVRVASDSRCPVDVECVWAGNAEVLLELRLKGRRGTKTLRLNTNASPERPNEAAYGRYNLKLSGLAPQRRSNQEIKPGRYTATLQVTKQ
jgi:hypothetical protein